MSTPKEPWVQSDPEIVARRMMAMKFYEQSLDKIPDPGTRAWRKSQLINEISGIDLTQPCEVITIPAGTVFQQRQGDVWTKGYYFSEVGISPTDVGIAERSAVTQYPREFTTQEFWDQYHQEHRDVIQETNFLGRELTDKELSDLHHRNAEIAKDIATEIGIRHAVIDAQNEIAKREGTRRDLTSDELHTIEQDIYDRIHKLRVPEGQELPVIRYEDIQKPMRLYVVTKDTQVFVSYAKGTEPGKTPLKDTWSRIANPEDHSALHEHPALPVHIKGGAIQYYSVESENFQPVIMTMEEYRQRAEDNPKIVPPKPEDFREPIPGPRLPRQGG